MPCHSVSNVCWDFTDVTLACEDSHNLSKSHATSPWLTSCQLLSVLTAMMLTLEQNKSHVVEARWKQKPCCWCWKNKAHDVDAGWKQTPFCWSRNKTKAFYFLSPFQTILRRKSFHNFFYLIQVQLLPCLVSHSVNQFLLLLRLDWCDPGVWRFTHPSPCLTSSCQFGFLLVVAWMCQNWYMDFSEL